MSWRILRAMILRREGWAAAATASMLAILFYQGKKDTLKESLMIGFDPKEVPWIDRPDFLSRWRERVARGSLAGEVAEHVRHFAEEGYTIIRRAIEPPLIKEFWKEYELAWVKRLPLKIRVVGREPETLMEIDTTTRPRQFRIMRAETLCPTLVPIMLHPRLVRILEGVFGEPIVAMQSLTYETSSGQGAHADFPYVKSNKLSHLAAAWVACEDVSDQNGALFFYPRSHRLDKYDWGGGRLSLDLNDPDASSKAEAFEQFLRKRVDEAGLEKRFFDARSGDVLLWHAALVHGGSAHQGRWSRRSVVFHYTTEGAYRVDRPMPRNVRRTYCGASYFELPNREEIWRRHMKNY